MRKSGIPLKLHGQPLKVLLFLASRPGEIVSREDIRREIWGDTTHVDFEQGLNFCVKQIRTYLNDDARSPQFVETLPRRGYRFIAPVEAIGQLPQQIPKSTHPDTPPPSPRSSRKLWLGIGAALVAVSAGVFVLARSPLAIPARKTTLLVLPFENLSADAKQEYFSDGMTEEITTQLGRLDPQQLGVLARTSAMRYKYTAYDSRDIADIGRELGADYIVEGSVRLADGRVRITARLNQVRDRSQIWTESYDHDLRDVLTLQAEVAQDIVAQIHRRISAHAPAPLPPPRPIRADVYDLYLRGRFYWNKRTLEDLNRAVSLFGEAVNLDPAYAAAYAGLADAHSALGHYGAVSPHDAYLNAKAAALKALELDPNLAEAHTALAAMKVDYEWDWKGAQKGFERAIELNPSYPTAHQWYAHYWSAVGRPDQAVLEARRALTLDPLSPLINSALGRHLYHAGRYDEAIRQLRKSVELDPGFALARLHLGWVYEARQALPDAIAEYEKAVALTGRAPIMIAALARASAAAGRRDESRKLLAEVLERAQQRYVPPVEIAFVYYALGDAQASLQWLKKAADEHSASLLYLPRHPWASRLRSDPTFADLLRQLKLPS